MKALTDRQLFKDKPVSPVISSFRGTLAALSERFAEGRLRRQFLAQAKSVSRKAVQGSADTDVRFPEQLLTLLWSAPVVRKAFDDAVQISGESNFLAAVLAVLSGRFVDLNLRSNQSVLMLAALCFAKQGRFCHLVLCHDDEIERCNARFERLADHIGVKLNPNKAQEAIAPDFAALSISDGAAISAVTLTTAQKLMAEYVAATPFRESDFHQRVISSHFGEKPLINPASGIDVVLVDRADSTLLDDYLRPLTLHSPRELPGFHTALKALLRWCENLDKSEYQVVGTAAHYVGERALQDTDSLKGLSGIWRSERVLRELSGSVLSAVYGYERDHDYVVREEKLCVLNPDTGEVVPGKTFPEWIRQSLEIKEGLEISPVSEVQLRKSYQAFFRERMHLAGTGSALRWNSRDLSMLFQSRFLNLNSHISRAGKKRITFFDPTLLSEAVRTQLGSLPLVRYVLCPDPSLLPSLEAVLAEQGAATGDLRVIPSVIFLLQLPPEQQQEITEEQILVIGLSATGREEIALEEFFRKPVNRMLPRNFTDKGVVERLIPEGLSGALYPHFIRRQQRKKRAALLSEQLRILKSEYGLRDQWI